MPDAASYGTKHETKAAAELLAIRCLLQSVCHGKPSQEPLGRVEKAGCAAQSQPPVAVGEGHVLEAMNPGTAPCVLPLPFAIFATRFSRFGSIPRSDRLASW